MKERKEDTPLRVETFLDELCTLHQKSRKQFTPDAMRMILDYAWPGNVRELKNTVERIVVTCSETEVRTEPLPSGIRASAPVPRDLVIPLNSSIEDVERLLIENTLTHVTSNRKEAARVLGISVRALHYKIKKYSL